MLTTWAAGRLGVRLKNSAAVSSTAGSMPVIPNPPCFGPATSPDPMRWRTSTLSSTPTPLRTRLWKPSTSPSGTSRIPPHAGTSTPVGCPRPCICWERARFPGLVRLRPRFHAPSARNVHWNLRNIACSATAGVWTPSTALRPPVLAERPARTTERAQVWHPSQTPRRPHPDAQSAPSRPQGQTQAEAPRPAVVR